MPGSRHWVERRGAAGLAQKGTRICRCGARKGPAATRFSAVPSSISGGLSRNKHVQVYFFMCILCGAHACGDEAISRCCVPASCPKRLTLFEPGAASTHAGGADSESAPRKINRSVYTKYLTCANSLKNNVFGWSKNLPLYFWCSLGSFAFGYIIRKRRTVDVFHGSPKRSCVYNCVVSSPSTCSSTAYFRYAYIAWLVLLEVSAPVGSEGGVSYMFSRWRLGMSYFFPRARRGVSTSTSFGVYGTIYVCVHRRGRGEIT